MTTQLPQCIPATMHCTPIEPCPTIRPPCFLTHVPATNCPPATVCPQPSTLCPPPQGGAQNFAATPTAATLCTQVGCPTYPQGDCTFFNCPTRICGGAGDEAVPAPRPNTYVVATNCPPATVCPQASTLCPPQFTPATVCTQINCPPRTNIPPCPPTNMPGCPDTATCPKEGDDEKKAAPAPADSVHICATTYTQPFTQCGPNCPIITPGTCLTTHNPTAPLVCPTRGFGCPDTVACPPHGGAQNLAAQAAITPASVCIRCGPLTMHTVCQPCHFTHSGPICPIKTLKIQECFPLPTRTGPLCPYDACLPLTVGPVLTPPEQQFAARAAAPQTLATVCTQYSAGCGGTEATVCTQFGCEQNLAAPDSRRICPTTFTQPISLCPDHCPVPTNQLAAQNLAAGAFHPTTTVITVTHPTPATHCFICPPTHLPGCGCLPLTVGPVQTPACQAQDLAAAPQARAQITPQSVLLACPPRTLQHPWCPIRTLDYPDCFRTHNPWDCFVWTRNSPLCPQPCIAGTLPDPVTWACQEHPQNLAARAIVPPPLSAPPDCPSVQPCHTQPPWCPILSAPPNCPTVQQCGPPLEQNLAARAAAPIGTITIHPTPATHCFICPPRTFDWNCQRTHNPWDCFVWTRNSPACPIDCFTGSVFDPRTPVVGGQQFAARAAAPPQEAALAYTPATVCTQFQCHTYPNGDCTFFGGCQTKDCTAPSHCGPCISPLPPCDIKTLRCTMPPPCPDPLTVRSHCGPCITPHPPCDLTVPISVCGPCITQDPPCYTLPRTACPPCTKSLILSQCGPCVTDLRTCHPQQCELTAPPQCPIKTDPVTCGFDTGPGCQFTPHQQFAAQRAQLTPPAQGPQFPQGPGNLANFTVQGYLCSRVYVCTHVGCLPTNHCPSLRTCGYFCTHQFVC